LTWAIEMPVFSDLSGSSREQLLFLENEAVDLPVGKPTDVAEIYLGRQLGSLENRYGRTSARPKPR